MLGSFYAIFWRSEAWGYCSVKLSSGLAGGLMALLAGSTNWDGFLRNFCTILAEIQSGQLQYCIMQTAWEVASSPVKFLVVELVH